jgi:hypothetical protein
MAIAGGATVAYQCKIVDGKLQRDKTTAMQTVAPLPAVTSILTGHSVIVAGSDVVVVARLLELELEIAKLISQVSDYSHKATIGWGDE